METVDSIKEAFRSLLKTTPYDRISIMELCTTASISKKTLYKYFEGKPDIVETLIYDDIVAPVLELRRILPNNDIKSASILMIERDFETMYDNREMYKNLLKNFGRMEFIDIIISITEKLNLNVYSTLNLSEADLKYSSYFVAAANAMVKTRWIENNFEESPKQMAKLTSEWTLSHLHYLRSTTD
jgi:AcrR family transcriptional regulator